MIKLYLIDIADNRNLQRLYYEWHDGDTLVRDYVEFETNDVEGCAHALETLGRRLLEVAGLEQRTPLRG